MKHEIPALGYVKISGTQPPPASWGDRLYTQLRNGWCDPEPWPVATSRWVHDGSQGDIVAVKREHEAPKHVDGRQANGSYA